jgi:hypothetical protein
MINYRMQHIIKNKIDGKKIEFILFMRIYYFIFQKYKMKILIFLLNQFERITIIATYSHYKIIISIGIKVKRQDLNSVLDLVAIVKLILNLLSLLLKNLHNIFF